MTNVPIAALISGKRLAVAALQDVVVEIIYDRVQYDAQMYGGTAIWRCYNGSRFSEDIDIYVKRGFVKKLEKQLPLHGLSITWRNPELGSDMRISDGVTEVLLEAKEGGAESMLVQYAKVDGLQSQ